MPIASPFTASQHHDNHSQARRNVVLARRAALGGSVYITRRTAAQKAADAQRRQWRKDRQRDAKLWQACRLERLQAFFDEQQRIDALFAYKEAAE